MESPSQETNLQLPSDESGPRSTTGSGPGGLLLVAGFGMTAAGTALALLPRFAPQFDWSVRNLASQGVTGGSIAVGGCVLLALGLAARAQARFFRTAGEPSDADLLLEHVANELTDIRSDIRDTNLRVSQVKDETRGLFEAVQARETMDTTDHQTADATYRLAASLDQLGARIEQRLGSQDASVGQAFTELREQLEGVRALAEELKHKEVALAPAVDPQPVIAPVPEPEPVYDTYAYTEPEGPPQGLALLDSLDRQAVNETEPPAPLPQSGPQSGMATPVPLSLRPGPIQINEGAIEEIRTLLADERVRDALQLGDLT